MGGDRIVGNVAERELEGIVRDRRALHRIPELGFELPETISYIEGALAGLSCEVTHPCESCVCAFFDVGRDRTTAIRADMDALPITEATGVPFASEHEGRMHACGHDAHMAMALAAARYVDAELLAHPESLPRNILFVFQPAEETTGGARLVCESGVFERYGADRIFGFHVWPDLPAGVVASRPGALLARSSEVHVAIHGRSTHVAKTYGVPGGELQDALMAAAHFLTGERWLARMLQQDEPMVCMFGQLEAGTACNAVADEARLAGSLRTFSDEMDERARREVEAKLKEACESLGCTYEIEFSAGYPPVENDAALFELAAGTLPELQILDEPLLISEDFSFYQRHLPGVFLLLGVGSEEYARDGTKDADVRTGGKGTEEASTASAAPVELPAGSLGYAGSALHTSTLMFDERILLRGLSVYKRLIHLA